MAGKSRTVFSSLFYNVVEDTHGTESHRYGRGYPDTSMDAPGHSSGHQPACSSSVMWGLEPVSRILRILGLLYERQGDNGMSPSFTYSLVLCFIVWLNNLRYFCSYTTVTSFDTQLFGKLAVHVWFMQCSLVFTIYLLTVRPGMKRLVQQMENYAFKYNTNSGAYLRKASKICVVVSIIILSLIFGVNTTMAFLVCDTVKYSQKYLAPFNFSENESPVYLKVIYICFHMYLSSIWTFATGHLVILCLGIRKNFRQLSMEINKGFPYANETGISIEQLRQRHQKLCSIVKMTDRLFSLYNLTIYFTGVPLVCFIIYTFAFTSVGGYKIGLGVAVFQMILINIQMGVLTAVASSVCISVSVNNISYINSEFFVHISLQEYFRICATMDDSGDSLLV